MILTAVQKECKDHKDWVDPDKWFCFTEKGEIVSYQDRFKHKKVYVTRWCKGCDLKMVFICEKGG